VVDDIDSSKNYGEEPIKLPPFNPETDDWLYWLEQFTQIKESDLLEYTAFITTPANYPWFVVTFNQDDILKGVQLGCDLFNVNCSEYIRYVFRK
jgi:hypothetical protein